MIINHQDGWIYLGPPRTGSTTLVKALTEEFGGEHLGISQHDCQVPESYRGYYQFATVRHPYARALSLWGMLQKDALRLPQVVEPYCREHGIGPDLSFEEFVDFLVRAETGPSGNVFYHWTCHDYLKDQRVTALLRMEQLNQDFVRLPFVRGYQLPVTNQHVWREFAGGDPRRLLTAKVRFQLQRWAQEDFRHYGYTDENFQLTAEPNRFDNGYQVDEQHLPFRYGLRQVDVRSRELFRLDAAPAQGAPVCLGSSYTFGRFVERPFPQRLSESLGRRCLNLGAGLASPEFYLRQPELLELIERAPVLVFQVMSARNSPNSCLVYADEACRAQLDTRTRQYVASPYDFWEQLRGQPSLYRQCYQESITSYRLAATELLCRAKGRRILLWWSRQRPAPPAGNPLDHENFYPNFHPQMVPSDVVDWLKNYADDYVEQVFNDTWQTDLPGAEPCQYYPSPHEHSALADRLAALLRESDVPTVL